MIHPTALVDPKAELADDVEVGAFTIIDAKVRIDAGTRVGPHAVLTGRTTIGKNNHIFQFTSIGEQPQDKKYAGEDTELIIGDNNTIRELCTFSRGSAQGGGVTRTFQIEKLDRLNRKSQIVGHFFSTSVEYALHTA